MVNLLHLQIVHRTLAAMLGSLAALAALAVIGDVSLLYLNLLTTHEQQLVQILYFCQNMSNFREQ